MERVVGTISSAGFPTGDRFVVGNWSTSPIGRLVDVMWATPDGTRILLVGDEAAAAFITSIYRFDEIRVDRLTVTGDGRRTTVDGHGLALDLIGGRWFPIPLRRPRFVTRWIEGPIARALLGVETYGVSPTGVREWYQARGWRWVVDGAASLEGRALGPPGTIDVPVGVGFSEPPRRPSIVSVETVIERPAGAAVGRRRFTR